MKFKLTGVLAIICAPFLFIDFLTATPGISTRQTGVFDLIYMTGWLCSLIVLYKQGAFGSKRGAKIVLAIQFLLLAGAQVWNMWVIIKPSSEGTLFRILDSCWPLSNIWMLATGIVALTARQLQGWKRFALFIAGLWFPFSMVLFMWKLPYWSSGLYSFLAFALLGLVVYQLKGTTQNAAPDNMHIAY